MKQYYGYYDKDLAAREKTASFDAYLVGRGSKVTVTSTCETLGSVDTLSKGSVFVGYVTLGAPTSAEKEDDAPPRSTTSLSPSDGAPAEPEAEPEDEDDE